MYDKIREEDAASQHTSSERLEKLAGMNGNLAMIVAKNPAALPQFADKGDFSLFKGFLKNNRSLPKFSVLLKLIFFNMPVFGKATGINSGSLLELFTLFTVALSSELP